MRIRKRKVPLPLSLLSPIPLSDPLLFSQSPVMGIMQGVSTTTTSIDHFTPHSSASDLRSLINSTHEGVGEDQVIAASNEDTSNASLTTAKRSGAPTTVDADDDDNNNADKAIPLKKRRVSFNNVVEDNITTATATATATTTVDTTMIMKTDVKNGVNDVDEANVKGNAKNGVVIVASSGKKGNSKRGNTIMEGSRCSRVNGRGWRCCQPTLVGYSLCEHHLGKGRLRSMTSDGDGGGGSSVKARTASKKNSSSSNAASLSRPLGRDERKKVDDDDDEKKLEMKGSFGNNKRVKLGVVKARSLSSLLGQSDYGAP